MALTDIVGYDITPSILEVSSSYAGVLSDIVASTQNIVETPAGSGSQEYGYGIVS